MDFVANLRGDIARSSRSNFGGGGRSINENAQSSRRTQRIDKHEQINVRLNGILVQIVLYQGMILDGRNRYAAAKAIGYDFHS